MLLNDQLDCKTDITEKTNAAHFNLCLDLSYPSHPQILQAPNCKKGINIKTQRGNAREGSLDKRTQFWKMETNEK